MNFTYDTPPSRIKIWVIFGVRIDYFMPLILTTLRNKTQKNNNIQTIYINIKMSKKRF